MRPTDVPDEIGPLVENPRFAVIAGPRFDSDRYDIESALLTAHRRSLYYTPGGCDERLGTLLADFKDEFESKQCATTIRYLNRARANWQVLLPRLTHIVDIHERPSYVVRVLRDIATTTTAKWPTRCAEELLDRRYMTIADAEITAAETAAAAGDTDAAVDSAAMALRALSGKWSTRLLDTRDFDLPRRFLAPG